MSKDKDTSRMKKLLGLSTTMPLGSGAGAAGGGLFGNLLGGGGTHNHGHTHGAGCGCSHGPDDAHEDEE